MAGSVLVVEDEREIRELLRRYLERAGLPVLTTAGGAEAIRMLGEGAARLVLLDLGLPDVDGEQVLRAARAAGEVPVIVLTARSAAEDRIRGLTLGAYDYVTKPFSPTEVVLRVQAVLHRAGRNEAEPGAACYGGGRLRVDQDRHEAVLDGRPLDLTPTEWGVLTALASVPGLTGTRLLPPVTAIPGSPPLYFDITSAVPPPGGVCLAAQASGFAATWAPRAHGNRGGAPG